MANASEWAERVAAWRASGLKASTFCADKDYSSKSLWHWSSRLNRERKASREAGRVPLARVVSDLPRPAPASTIVIELSGARVHVSSGVDATSLQQALEAVRAAAQRGSR